MLICDKVSSLPVMILMTILERLYNIIKYVKAKTKICNRCPLTFKVLCPLAADDILKKKIFRENKIWHFIIILFSLNYTKTNFFLNAVCCSHD